MLRNNRYIRNPNIRYRAEGKGAVLFDARTRRVFILARELFNAWQDIEELHKRHLDGSLSELSYKTILDRFLSDGLIK